MDNGLKIETSRAMGETGNEASWTTEFQVEAMHGGGKTW